MTDADDFPLTGNAFRSDWFERQQAAAARHRLIPQKDWEALAKDIKGGAELHLPGTAWYDANYRPQNHFYSYLRPAGIVRVLDQAKIHDLTDPQGLVNTAVGRAVRWARDHKMRIAVRSGGHSYAGFSATTGLLIDFGGQQTVYEPTTDNKITFGTGMQGRWLYPALRDRYPNAYIPTGRCPTVAIGGLALGGGAGFLDRKWGLTCDQMLQSTMVTADGKVLVCDDRHEQDLFWAIRGAGQGNFGIHTSFQFQGQPLPTAGNGGIATFFKITWNIEDAFPLIDLVQNIVQEKDKEFDKIEGRLGISTYGLEKEEIEKNLNTNIIGIYHGGKDEFEDLFEPLIRGPVSPVEVELAEGPLAEFLSESYAFQTIPTVKYTSKSGVVDRPFSPDAAQKIIDWVKRWPGSAHPTEGGGVALFTLGGAINRKAPDETAFFHRRGIFFFNIDASFAEEDPRQGAVLNWAQDFYLDMREHRYISEHCYQSFPDRSLADWEHAYYGTNYPKLQRIKAHYDPENFFQYAQSIRPTTG
ncbi:FAD-binding oxidoreductase [Nocardiopsis alba]|uniref:FAD binding domain protein n=1 Tax=Nocardiopsis alba (strain ATCC BAA-2165 / BE74) TaxID=1205910 RepID=J7L7L1_NOCAA|nr:FAD-binding protein [Nocardiopsis alba]AFR06447.1 FAD binding domain protein [Nocardiopsis alba ATCC BAA-2165]